MEQRRLLRDSLFNLSASALTAGLGLVAVPLFVSRLPTAAYADWIVTLATAKTVLLFDFGACWTIVHVVAAQVSDMNEQTRAHLRAAATFMLGLAIVAAVITFAAGAIQFGTIGGYRAAILGAGAVMAAMSCLNNYSMGVLWGLRRFDLSGTIITLEAAAQAGGVVVILFLDGGVVAVAAWEATVVSVAAIAKIVIADRLCPEAAFRPAWRWPTAPMRLVRFGLTSQLSDGFASLFWTLGVLIVGQTAGSAAVVMFHIAQKVPLALAGFVSRAAEVAMPAASGLPAAASDVHATVAVSAARIALALSVPAAVTIWIIADPFMTLWVGDGTEAAATIMRIAAAAVVAHSLGESARCFLWGSGRIGTILIVQSGGALLILAAAGFLFWITRLDAVSFSALQAVAVGIMSITLSFFTAGRAGLSARTYTTRVARGIPLAACAALAAGMALAALWPPWSWWGLSVIAASVTAAFAASMVAFGLESDESVALRHLFRMRTS